VNQDGKLFFALANALFDASIACWDCKRAYDSIRPVSAVHYLFNGKTVTAWGGPGKGTVSDMPGENWAPYQKPTVVTPPFPEYVSGHSTFSAAGAYVLQQYTGSDTFGDSYTQSAGSSLIEPGFGIPQTAITLSWPTFSAAAVEAGMSRRYAGVHQREGSQVRRGGRLSLKHGRHPPRNPYHHQGATLFGMLLAQEECNCWTSSLTHSIERYPFFLHKGDQKMQHFVSGLPTRLVIVTAMVVMVASHAGEELAHRVGQFAPLLGAFVGGSLTLWSAVLPENCVPATPISRQERFSWLLIGAGSILWGVGESFWRYYLSVGRVPFPSLADIGHASFPVLVFLGLLLQPSSGTNQRRIMLTLDSIIVAGTVFAHAWYFALGRLVLAPGKVSLAKVFAIYYPATDVILLSCVVILLLRGQRPFAQLALCRVVPVALGVGLGFFTVSDFVFNARQNVSSSAGATWLHLGWPLGMMIIGIAAYFHRCPQAAPTSWKAWLERAAAKRSPFNPLHLLSYVLLTCQFVVLLANGLTGDRLQQAIRPVLLFVTLLVACLLIARLTMTVWEHVRLMQRQAALLQDQRDMTARVIAVNAELESGIDHLQEVLTKLANGDLQARANLPKGNLWPLGQSINILANRLARAAARASSEPGRYRAAPSRITDMFPALLALFFSCLATP
jgi:PAP2 superfamily